MIALFTDHNCLQKNTILKLRNISQKCILYKNDYKKCPHEDIDEDLFTKWLDI